MWKLRVNSLGTPETRRRGRSTRKARRALTSNPPGLPPDWLPESASLVIISRTTLNNLVRREWKGARGGWGGGVSGEESTGLREKEKERSEKKDKSKKRDKKQRTKPCVLFVRVSMHLCVQVCAYIHALCVFPLCLCVFTLSFSHLITAYIEVLLGPGGLLKPSLLTRQCMCVHTVCVCVYLCEHVLKHRCHWIYWE